MHVSDALWFTYPCFPFRGPAHSRRTCSALRILLTIPIGLPLQAPQHGYRRKPQRRETLVRGGLVVGRNEQLPGLKRTGGTDCFTATITDSPLD